jgi:hypothetical protein
VRTPNLAVNGGKNDEDKNIVRQKNIQNPNL